MSMFMFLLPALILSGFLYPAWTMPRPLQWLALLDPIRHFLTVVRGVFLKGAGMAQFWPQLLTLAAMAAGALTLAILRFRKSLA
jgi:ABC-2 type transport system permease protein